MIIYINIREDIQAIIYDAIEFNAYNKSYKFSSLLSVSIFLNFVKTHCNSLLPTFGGSGVVATELDLN
jgi:hypothetical protein